MNMAMASIYSCKECGANFNLHSNYLYPPDFYFEAGNKGTLSFAMIDSSKFKFEKEDKIVPFFETVNYWGIQRKRTKIKCNSCGCLVGYVYDDGPPMTDSPGQFHMGPSQVIPRAPSVRDLQNQQAELGGIFLCEIKFNCLELLKKMGIESKHQNSKLKNVSNPPTAPPLPPKPKFLATAKPAIKPSTVVSVTNQQIAKYWRQKRMDEEDHLLAAIKAAARIKARNLSEDDYRLFEESLKEDNDDSKENNKTIKNSSQKDENSNEIRVGIRDWWTKSKYAYLNQPAIESTSMPKRRASTYTPQYFCYKSAPPPVTTTFGIF